MSLPKLFLTLAWAGGRRPPGDGRATSPTRIRRPEVDGHLRVNGYLTRPLGLTALTLLLAVTLPRLRAEAEVGKPFPSLAAASLAGTVPTTVGQVVLVDFWASWCAPCKASFPAFAKLHANFAARGLVIVAVSVDEKASAYDGFIKKMKPPFAVVHDAAQKLVSEVKVPSMPTSYLIGRDGRLRFLHSGFHGDATERELRQEIETLLAEK